MLYTLVMLGWAGIFIFTGIMYVASKNKKIK